LGFFRAAERQFAGGREAEGRGGLLKRPGAGGRRHAGTGRAPRVRGRPLAGAGEAEDAGRRALKVARLPRGPLRPLPYGEGPCRAGEVLRPDAGSPPHEVRHTDCLMVDGKVDAALAVKKKKRIRWISGSRNSTLGLGLQ
jgi:hypothetical protein